MDTRQELGGWLHVFLELGHLVHKALSRCAAVAPPSVSVDDGTRLNAVHQEGPQVLGGGFRDLAHADTPDSLSIFLSCHHNQNLLFLLPAAKPFFRTAQISLIHLDPTGQPLTSGSNHPPTQFM